MAADGEQLRGRTRWRRFLLTFTFGATVAAVLLTGMSSGAIAASFTVSGATFKISATELRGQGVVQYGTVDQSAGNAYPVLATGFVKVEADNFCQSFVVHSVPVFNDLTIRITAPGQTGFSADNLVIGSQSLTGNLTMSNVQLGHDAGQLDNGPPGVHGLAGSFGIQASGLTLDQLQEVSTSTTAATLRLNRVQISALGGTHECF